MGPPRSPHNDFERFAASILEPEVSAGSIEFVRLARGRVGSVLLSPGGRKMEYRLFSYRIGKVLAVSGEPAAFMSYVRFNDAHDDGQVRSPAARRPGKGSVGGGTARPEVSPPAGTELQPAGR